MDRGMAATSWIPSAPFGDAELNRKGGGCPAVEDPGPRSSREVKLIWETSWF